MWVIVNLEVIDVGHSYCLVRVETVWVQDPGSSLLSVPGYF